ncbi:MAG: response regulator [Betaproteobacteria bacterium]|nr:response regulator [Betaproteobacteria bacterium]
MAANRRWVRILHLEDNLQDAELILRQLQAAGFDCDVVRAADGAEYETALAGGNFDLVLCDFSVPGYDALLALKRARELRPDLPFVVISGELSEEQAVECLRAGATDYLLKHRLQRLVPAVQRALEEAVERKRRHLAEIARRESEDRFRSVVAAMAEGVIVQDRRGRIIARNAAASRILGLTGKAPGNRRAADQRQRTIREDGSTVCREKHPAIITLRTGRAQSQVVLGMETDGGELRWLSINTEPLKHAGDETPYAVVTTLVDITDRKRAEAKLREHASNLRELTRRLVEVEEEERRNINRELHDRVGQDLAAVKLNIELVRATLAEVVRAQVGPRLDDAQKLLQATIDNTRNIMAELRPPGLDDYGLAVALKAHADTVAQRLGIPVRVSGEDPAPRLPPAVETALYRIAQEALNNIAKYARAKNVEIALATHASDVTLTVADDGTGFDLGNVPADSYGLRIMRERAEAVGARLEVASTPGRGTHIAVNLESPP